MMTLLGSLLLSPAFPAGSGGRGCCGVWLSRVVALRYRKPELVAVTSANLSAPLRTRQGVGDIDWGAFSGSTRWNERSGVT